MIPEVPGHCTQMLHYSVPLPAARVDHHGEDRMGAGGVTGEHSLSGRWLNMLYIINVGLLASYQMGLSVYGS